MVVFYRCGMMFLIVPKRESNKYTVYVCHRWQQLCYVCSSYNISLFHSFVIYHRTGSKSEMTGITSSAKPANPSEALDFTPSFPWGLCCLVFKFLCRFFCTIFCLLVLFLLVIIASVSLTILLFVHRFMATDCPLVSSNLCYTIDLVHAWTNSPAIVITPVMTISINILRYRSQPSDCWINKAPVNKSP